MDMPFFLDNIAPPHESDMATDQSNPILDPNAQKDLDSFFDNPDTNALQNPSLTGYMNIPNLGIDMNPNPFDTFSPSWNFQSPSFDHEHSPVPFTHMYGDRSLQHSRTNGNTPTMPTHHPLLGHTTMPQQPSHAALSSYGIAEDAPEDVVQAATKLFFYQSQQQAFVGQPQSAHPSHSSHSASLPSQSVFRRQSPPRERQHSDVFTPHGTAPSQSFSTLNYAAQNTQFPSVPAANAAFASVPNFSFAARGNSYQNVQPYQFGSDNNFNQNGYSGPFQQPNEQKHIDFARGMAPVRLGDSGVPSAASSHPQSPVASRQDVQYQPPHSLNRRHMKQEPTAEDVTSSHNPPKRRRTIVASAEGEGSRYASYSGATPIVYQESSPEGNGVSPADSRSSVEDGDDGEDMPARRRKRRKSSSGGQAKASAAARKNLTEEQKRENHIKSEQKRRNIIKDGYKNLNDLVPNLRQGGFSKSATLSETVRELETLQEANGSFRTTLMARLTLTAEELDAMMDAV